MFVRSCVFLFLLLVLLLSLYSSVRFSYCHFHAVWNMIKWWYVVLINQINSDVCGKHYTHSLTIVVVCLFCWFCSSLFSFLLLFFLSCIQYISCDNHNFGLFSFNLVFNWIEIIKRNLFFVSNYGLITFVSFTFHIVALSVCLMHFFQMAN